MSYRCTVCEGCESSDGSEFKSVNESEYEWWFTEEESEHEDIEGKHDETQSKTENEYPNEKNSENVNHGSTWNKNYAGNGDEKNESNNKYPKEKNSESAPSCSSCSDDKDSLGNESYAGNGDTYSCTVCEGCESSDGSEFKSVNESEYEWWFTEEESEHEDIEGKHDETQSNPNKKESETVNDGTSGDDNYAENRDQKTLRSDNEDLSGNKYYVGNYEGKKRKSNNKHRNIENVNEPCSDDDSSSANEQDEEKDKSKYPNELEDVSTNEVAFKKAITNSDFPKRRAEHETLSENENLLAKYNECAAPPSDKENLSSKKEPVGKEDSSNEDIPTKDVEQVLVKEFAAPTMLAGYRGGKHRRGRRPKGHTRGSSGRYRRPYRRRQRRHVRRHVWTTSVNMPTGTPQKVTVPVKPGMKWKCGDKSKLINLNPNGKMGKKEFDLVSNEMKNSSTGKKFQVTKVEKIVNACLWKQYRFRRRVIIGECGKANERFLFHGSNSTRNLVDVGLDERYAKISGLFGAGIYFACNSNKSHGYTHGTGQMLLCRVLLGNSEQVKIALRKAHPSPQYHSVEGMVPLREYVVYRGEQVYPEYLITYK